MVGVQDPRHRKILVTSDAGTSRIVLQVHVRDICEVEVGDAARFVSAYLALRSATVTVVVAVSYRSGSWQSECRNGARGCMVVDPMRVLVSEAPRSDRNGRGIRDIPGRGCLFLREQRSWGKQKMMIWKEWRDRSRLQRHNDLGVVGVDARRRRNIADKNSSRRRLNLWARNWGLPMLILREFH